MPAAILAATGLVAGEFPCQCPERVGEVNELEQADGSDLRHATTSTTTPARSAGTTLPTPQQRCQREQAWLGAHQTKTLALSPRDARRPT